MEINHWLTPFENEVEDDKLRHIVYDHLSIKAAIAVAVKDEVKDFTGTYTKKLSVVDYGKGIYTISLINAKNEAVKKILVY